jgi:hypothetical protein
MFQSMTDFIWPDCCGLLARKTVKAGTHGGVKLLAIWPGSKGEKRTPNPFECIFPIT